MNVCDVSTPRRGFTWRIVAYQLRGACINYVVSRGVQIVWCINYVAYQLRGVSITWRINYVAYQLRGACIDGLDESVYESVSESEAIFRDLRNLRNLRWGSQDGRCIVLIYSRLTLTASGTFCLDPSNPNPHLPPTTPPLLGAPLSHRSQVLTFDSS
jgi:hypothetical protein